MAFWFLVMLMVFTACAPEAAPPPTRAAVPPALTPTPAEVAPAPKAPAKELWEEKWEKVVTAARTEGRVMAYMDAGAEVRRAVGEAFKGKHELSIEFVGGRAAEIVAKLQAERRAGLYLGDIVITGVGPTFVQAFKPAGIFDPLEPALILPDITDPAVIEKVWWGGKLLWGDESRLMLVFLAFPGGKVGVNTSLVKPEEIKSYRDLLDPKWKGKITVNDPTVVGTGNIWFGSMLEGIMSVDYLRELAKQNPVIVRDQRLQVEWLAHGKYPIAISPREEIMTAFIRAGAPVMYLTPLEGSYITMSGGGIGLVNRAPHPNAARVFINWFLTKEGQTVFSKAYGSQSAREDVPTDFLDPVTVREPGVKYFNSIGEGFAMRRQGYIELAKEIFGAR